ncbi:serine-rich adhesin for platelets-like isoform X2 [Anguilla rostrata]|uniref:serine-rich adhesin for platelets-like isoform X2 n=1 Tax=Anguilla rostrata TaxID=7938 RepID=UPI0030D53D51
MLKVLVLCLLNSSVPIPCTKQGLWSKLRGVLLDNSSDIYQTKNVSFTYCLCNHKDVCKMDASQQINFRPLCPCWRYDHNQSWPYFQLQEANKDNAESKGVITVHFYPCDTRKAASRGLTVTPLQQVSGCPRTRFHVLRGLSLREKQRLCTWTERRLTTWQLVPKKDDARKSGGRRFRRDVPTPLSPPMTLATSTLTDTQSWTGTSSSTLASSDVTMSLSTFYQSDSATGGASFTQDSVVKLMSIYGTPVSVERSSGFHLSTDLAITEDYNRQLSDALQKTPLTEESHQTSPTPSFQHAGSYGLSSETYANSDSEIPWNKLYSDSEMSLNISLATSDASFIDDVASVEPTAFKESLDYWHQTSFLVASPTSRMTSLRVSDGMTVSPSLSDEEMRQASGRMSLNILNGPSDVSDLSPTFRESIVESAGSEAMETGDTLILQSSTGGPPHSAPAAGAGASDESFEPSAPATAEQFPLSSVHTVPHHQSYESSPSDWSSSVYGAGTSEASDPSLTDTLEAPSSMQPTPALEDSKLPVESSDSVTPSDSDSFEYTVLFPSVYSPSLYEYIGSHWPLRTYSDHIIDVSAHTPVLVSSKGVGLNEPLTSSQESIWLNSSTKYQLSTSPGLETLSEFSTASSLRDSQGVTTEQHPPDSLQPASFSGLSGSQYPVSVSSAENVMSNVLGPVMETRVSLSDSEIVIDGLQTEALSPTATTRLAVVTGSIFDSAGNGLYTELESVGPSSPHVSSDAPSSTALSKGPLIHSQLEAPSISHYYGEGLESSSNIDFRYSASPLPSPLSRPGSASSASDDGKVEVKETVLQTGGFFSSASLKETPIFSLESFGAGALETLSVSHENVDGATLEKSASLSLPVESAETSVFTSLKDLYQSQSVTVSTEMLEDTAGFDRQPDNTVFAPISSVSVQQTLQPDYSSRVDPESSGQFLWDTQSVSHLIQPVPGSSMHFSTEGNEYTLHPSFGVSSILHHISSTFKTVPVELVRSTASVTEMIDFETRTSAQISEKTFLLEGTEQLSKSEIKSLISLSSAEKPYSEGMTPSSSILALHPSYLMTSVTLSSSVSDALPNSASSADGASVGDASDLLSPGFSTSSFPGSSCVGVNSDTLCAAPVWLSAGSSASSPAGVSAEPRSSSASRFSLSPTIVGTSAGFKTDLPEGISTVTSVHFGSYGPRTDIWPTTSFGPPAPPLSMEPTQIYRGTSVPSSPPSQSRTLLAPLTGLTAAITPSLVLPSVTKTVPSFAAESTVGITAASSSLSPISSPLPLTQFTPPLQSSSATTTSSSMTGKYYYSSSIPATKAPSINTEPGPTSQPITAPQLTSQPITQLRPPLSTSVLASAPSLSLANSTVLNVIGSYSTLPLLSLASFPTTIPTPLLPTSKASGLVTSVTSSSDAASSKPASLSSSTSSPSPVSTPRSQGAETSGWTSASQAVSPPGPVRPNGTSAPTTAAPAILQEHLLEIALQVNGTVDVFAEGFRTAVADGLLLTFLQASRLNQTRARRAADPLVTVEIYSVSRTAGDSVLVQFVVLQDGKPMSAADVLTILNRLPDLLGTLNDNLPFPVTQVPSAVAVSPLAQFAGWLAAVVVLAAVCVLLAALLGVFAKKSQARGREAQSVQKRALTPFKKGRLHMSVEPASEAGPWDTEEGGAWEEGPSVATPTAGPAPRSPEWAAAPSPPRETPPRGKRPAPLKKLKRKRRKVKNTTRHHRATPEESSTEESTGDRDTEEVTPGRQVPQNASGVGQTRQRRFKSTVTPLPRLQPQRLTDLVSPGPGTRRFQWTFQNNARCFGLSSKSSTLPRILLSNASGICAAWPHDGEGVPLPLGRAPAADLLAAGQQLRGLGSTLAEGPYPEHQAQRRVPAQPPTPLPSPAVPPLLPPPGATTAATAPLLLPAALRPGRLAARRGRDLQRGRPVAVPGAPQPVRVRTSPRQPPAQPGLPELPAAAERADRRGAPPGRGQAQGQEERLRQGRRREATPTAARRGGGVGVRVA